jgi:DNA repair protein RecO (recombination protein O)
MEPADGGGRALLYKAEAIVLRTYPFGEADRVVVLLTAEQGKVRAVAKGVSRGKSRLAAAVQPFTHGRFLLWQGRELDGISQADIVRPSYALTSDLAVLAAASYAVELVDAFWEDRQEAPEAFALLRESLDWLGGGGVAGPSFLRHLELRVLSAAGFAPELGACANCGRPLAEGSPARYVPARGGLCCTACGGEGRSVGPAAARWMRELAGADLARLPLAAEAAKADAAAALYNHVTFVLGHPLRSRSMLEILP